MKSLASSLVTLKGPRGAQYITASVADEKTLDKSMLVIENRGNQSCVRELRLAPIGRTLRYSVPKAPKDVELAQGPVTREQVLIAVRAK
jgi:hypothetical protein